MSNTATKKMARKVIKPLNPTEFDSSNVNLGQVKTNTENTSKWVDATYEGNDKFLVVVRGCIIKTFTKQENKSKTKGDVPNKGRYQLFMGIKDESFIEMVNKYEDYLISKGVENCEDWFGNEMTEEECRDMLKPLVPKHEKYGYSAGGVLARDFTWDSKVEEVSKTTPYEEAFQKGAVVDVVYSFNTVKFGTGKYYIGTEIVRINLMGVGGEGGYVSNAITLAEFQPGKITLTDKQKHEGGQGGSFCKVLYNDKPLRIRLTEVEGRVFEFTKDDKTSYTISIRLKDKKLREMVETIDTEVLNTLIDNSEKYMEKKKQAATLVLKKQGLYKLLCSFSKKDLELIKEKKEPANPPSLWIKIYYNEEKGFDNKIINSETGKPINKPSELINKDVLIPDIEVYSRHLWFGKTYSVNLTLNRCNISYDAPDFDMGDNANDEEEEAENSDNDE